MKLYMIRHGQTKGNEEKRYVGVTDEPLSREGREQLTRLAQRLRNVEPDILLSSPMKRCKETMEFLFPNKNYQVVEEFRECDFGDFEYKNYQELNGDKQYQNWIDSGGTEPFPRGESPQDFRKRCQNAFLIQLERIRKMADDKNVETVVMVIHGGTIMAILDAFSTPHQDYFSWQVGNGNGYVGKLVRDEQEVILIKKLLE